jgi:hypothetical protein
VPGSPDHLDGPASSQTPPNDLPPAALPSAHATQTEASLIPAASPMSLGLSTT